MATFTFRIPDSMVGRLGSAEMRSWLSQLLRNPRPLPPDPGSGYERISLTLPRELVRDVAGYLRCSPSIALRRVAAVYLGGLQAPIPAPVNAPTIPVAASAPRPTQADRTPVPEGYWRKAGHDTPHPTPSAGEMVVSLLIQGLIWVLIVGALLFFTARKNKEPKAA